MKNIKICLLAGLVVSNVSQAALHMEWQEFVQGSNPSTVNTAVFRRGTRQLVCANTEFRVYNANGVLAWQQPMNMADTVLACSGPLGGDRFAVLSDVGAVTGGRQLRLNLYLDGLNQQIASVTLPTAAVSPVQALVTLNTRGTLASVAYKAVTGDLKVVLVSTLTGAITSTASLAQSDLKTQYFTLDGSKVIVTMSSRTFVLPVIGGPDLPQFGASIMVGNQAGSSNLSSANTDGSRIAIVTTSGLFVMGLHPQNGYYVLLPIAFPGAPSITNFLPQQVALSTDGRTLAIGYNVIGQATQLKLFIYRLTTPVPADPSTTTAALVWSQDLVNTTGNGLQMIIHDIDISLDGFRVAFGASGSGGSTPNLFVVRATDGTATSFVTDVAEARQGSVKNVVVMPDNHSVVPFIRDGHYNSGNDNTFIEKWMP